jgi:hypothetical protein
MAISSPSGELPAHPRPTLPRVSGHNNAAVTSTSGEIAAATPRPTLQGSVTGPRQADPRLEGLLAKLRDPSCRNLGALVAKEEKNQITGFGSLVAKEEKNQITVADEDEDMKPVSRRAMFAKLKTNNQTNRSDKQPQHQATSNKQPQATSNRSKQPSNNAVHDTAVPKPQYKPLHQPQHHRTAIKSTTAPTLQHNSRDVMKVRNSRDSTVSNPINSTSMLRSLDNKSRNPTRNLPKFENPSATASAEPTAATSNRSIKQQATAATGNCSKQPQQQCSTLQLSNKRHPTRTFFILMSLPTTSLTTHTPN